MPPHQCFYFQFCSVWTVWGSLLRQISTYWTLLYTTSKCVHRLMPAVSSLSAKVDRPVAQKNLNGRNLATCLSFNEILCQKSASVSPFCKFSHKKKTRPHHVLNMHIWTFWTVCKSHSNFMKWECISAIKPISCKTRQPEICTIQPYLCLSIDYTLSGIITHCCYHLWIFHDLHCILLH